MGMSSNLPTDDKDVVNGMTRHLARRGTAAKTTVPSRWSAGRGQTWAW